MSFSSLQLFLLGIGYLAILFGMAWIAERGFVPKRLLRHPITHVLSLGVYASAWAFYGSVGLAYEYGYGFLSYYLGISGAFLLAPVLLAPVLRITKAYQLGSIADLFTFRYRSQWAGTLTTLFMLLSMLSLLALQIKAVTGSIQVLSPGETEKMLGFIFCGVMVVFAILFGARERARNERYEGLVFAVAFEALVKLVLFLVMGGYALFAIFGGPEGLNLWLQESAPQISALEQRMGENTWRALLLVFFASALVMPHMFHMTFTENTNPKALFKASWGLPLYLLLMALPVPIILWAGIKTGTPTSPELFTVGFGLFSGAPWVGLLAFVGGLSAASGLIIVVTLALSSMILNHLILPVYQPLARDNIYGWLKWVKRILIVAIIFSGYLFYIFVDDRVSMSVLGILSFVATLQFFPGILAVIYWPLGNRIGFISGLCSGMFIWFFAMLLPLVFHIDIIGLSPWGEYYQLNEKDSHFYTMASLSLNVAVFALVSLLTKTSPAEQAAAQSCSAESLARPTRHELVASSSEEFKLALAHSLGRQTAEKEVHRALRQLELPNVEFRPYALRRLRDQIEANLSGLLGPSIAQDIVKRYLEFKSDARSTDIYFVESRLEAYQSRLTGLAAELDALRRYHRQTLQSLPIGACSLGDNLEVLMWNTAMEGLTSIPAQEVIGSHISAIDQPWANLLHSFAQDEQMHLYKHRVDIAGRPHWFNLHKANIESNEQSVESGQVILIEDQTELQVLEDELIHSERLASIGRLAAGVAHEIGNPITGIACLTQNLKLMTQDREVLESAGQILEQTKRVSRILQTLMNFSRAGNHAQPQVHEPANIKRCVNEAISLLSLSDKEKQLEFINECDEDVIVMGDEQRLLQVFVNLLSNARDASPEHARVIIRGHMSDYTAKIEIIDEGCGIAKDQLDHLFEPFYTTKGPDKGTGLGLSLVYSIIEEHYGHIQITSPADPLTGRGAKVSIELPSQYSDAKPQSQHRTEVS